MSREKAIEAYKEARAALDAYLAMPEPKPCITAFGSPDIKLTGARLMLDFYGADPKNIPPA